MSEPSASDQLSAFLDGELTDIEAAELEKMLAQDPRLRAELSELREVREMLRTHGPARAPAGFADRVLAMVEDEPLPANTSWWHWLRRPFGMPIEGLAVAATALLVVLAGLNLGKDQVDSILEDAAPSATPSPAATPPEGQAAEQHLDPEAPKQAQDTGSRRQQGASAPQGYDIDAVNVPVKPTTSTGTRAPPKSAPAYAPPAPSTAKEPMPEEKGGTSRGVEEPMGTAAEAGGTPDQSTSVPTSGMGWTSPRNASWGYQIVQWDADIVADLLRIAAKHQGQVLDPRSAYVTRAEALDPARGGVFYVQIPASELTSFDDAIRSLSATPTGQVDAKMYPSGTVQVRIDVVAFERAYEVPADSMEPPSYGERKKSRPAQ